MRVHYYDKYRVFDFECCEKYKLGLPLSTCKDWVTCRECIKKYRIRVFK